MGNFLDTPIIDKETDVGEDESKGLKYGLSAMQGWRAQMEDDHVQILSLPQVRPARTVWGRSCSRRVFSHADGFSWLDGPDVAAAPCNPPAEAIMPCSLSSLVAPPRDRSPADHPLQS